MDKNLRSKYAYIKHRLSKVGQELPIEWATYALFEAWATTIGGYAEGYSLVKKNASGPYDPTNCIFLAAPEYKHFVRRILMEKSLEGCTC